jgi:hypothetical protein
LLSSFISSIGAFDVGFGFAATAVTLYLPGAKAI